MKRKLFTVVLMLLIVCLCGSMLALAACNPNRGDGTPATVSKSTSAMFDEVLAKLEGSNYGDAMAVDVSANYVAEGKKAFTLTAKGNIGLRNSGADEKTNFVFELNKIKEDGGNDTMLGIAYEVIEGVPYFYINLLGGEDGYRKINGYSFSALYAMTNPTDAAATAAADSEESAGLVNVTDIIFKLLVGSEGTTDGSTYTFNFNLNNTLSYLNDSLSLIVGQLGLSVDMVNGLIAKLFGDLSYTLDGEEKTVATVKDLMYWAELNLNASGQIVVKFNGDQFESINFANSDYSVGDIPEAGYSLNIEKGFFGKSATEMNAFDGFAMTADERAAAQAYNLLNFQLKGQARGINKTNQVKTTYDIEIDSDINPLVLLNLVGQSDAPAIASALKELGYFRFTVDETTAGKQGNILTIFLNSSDNYLMLNFKGYKMILYQPGFGGVYDLDSLAVIIENMLKPSDDAEEEGSSIDIMSLLPQIIGLMSTGDNIAQNGLTIDMAGLKTILTNMLGGSFTTGLGIGALLNSSSAPFLNIKVFDTVFGACDKTFEASDVVNGNRTTFKNQKFIKSIDSIPALDNLVIDVNVPFIRTLNPGTNNITGNAENGYFFEMQGKGIDGADVTSSGFIMSYEGIDFSTPGEYKNVKFYIANGTDVYSLLFSMDMDLDTMAGLPLFGVLPYTVDTIVVREYNENAEISLSNSHDAVASEQLPTNFVAGKTNVFKSLCGFGGILNADVKIGDVTTHYYNLPESAMIVRDDKGVEITNNEEFYSNGTFVNPGKYNITINVGQYSKSFDVYASAFELEVIDPANIQETVAIDETYKVNYKVVETYYDVDTQALKKRDCQETVTPSVYGGPTSDTYSFNDGNTELTFAKQLSLGGSTFYLSFGTTVYGTKLSFSAPKVTITSQYSWAGNTSYTWNWYANVPVNDDTLNIKVKKGNIVYTLTYDLSSSSLVFVDENGNKLADDYSVSIKNGENEISFVSGGYPNIAFTGTASSITLKFALSLNGLTYNHDIKYNLPYVKNVTTNFYTNETLLTMSNANNIRYNLNGKWINVSFAYDKEQGYGLYYLNSMVLTKAYDVTVSVKNFDNAEVNLVNGKFAAAGKYHVTYTFTLDDKIERNMTFDVTVKDKA